MIVRFAVLGVAALTLAACGDGKGRCKAPELPKVPPAARAAGPDAVARLDAQTATDGARICVQRYAWKLAKSEDETPVVAEAVVTACDTAIAKVTEAQRVAYGTSDMNAAQDANIKTMTRWATLYLVQYRAGVCD